VRAEPEPFKVEGGYFDSGKYSIVELMLALLDATTLGFTHIEFDAGYNNIMATLTKDSKESVQA